MLWSQLHANSHPCLIYFFLFIPFSYFHFPPSSTETHSTLFDVSVMYVSLKNDSVQFSHPVMSDSLRPHGLQHARLPCRSPTPSACSNLCHPTISSSVFPFFSRLQSFQHQGLFQWVSSSHQVAKVLELQLQHYSFQWIFRTDFL